MATPKSKVAGCFVDFNRTRIFGAALLSAKTKALRDAAAAGVAESKRVVPVDTGKLRDSIVGEVDGDTAVISTDVEYGPHVEYGTVHMAARPYMRPGYEAAREFFVKRMAAVAVGTGGGTGALSSTLSVRIEAEVGGDA